MKKILEMKFGSHLYGTSTPDSDTDFKAIYLPTAREIILHTYKKTDNLQRPKQPFERNKKDDVDIEIFSLDQYLKLLCEGQTMALDMLFAPEEFYTWQTKEGEIFSYIYNNREQFLNKNVNAFVGYARKQAAKYGVKGFRVAALRSTLDWLSLQYDENQKLAVADPAGFAAQLNNEHVKITECRGPAIGVMEPHLEVNDRKIPFHATIKYAKQVLQKIFDQYGQRALIAEKNEGIDWKALSHAVRVNSEAVELLLTSQITFPRPDRELLLAIKTGQMEYKEVGEIIESGLEQLKGAQEKSTLRDKPNLEFANDIVAQVYGDIVKSEK